jgi:hypothetical protein
LRIFKAAAKEGTKRRSRMKKGRFTEEQIIGVLKHLVADLSLDREVVKSVIKKRRLELVGVRKDVSFARQEHRISERRKQECDGLCKRHAGDRTGNPAVDCGGRSHSRMPFFRGRYQHVGTTSEALSGHRDRTSRKAGSHSA